MTEFEKHLAAASAPQTWGNPQAAPVAKTVPTIPAHIVAEMQRRNFAVNGDGLLLYWDQLKKDLEVVKSSEMEVRKLTVDLLLGANKQEGTNNVELGNGYVAKAVVKFNYRLVAPEGKDVVTEVDNCIDDMVRLDNEGAFIAERLFKWQAPTFSLTEWRKLEVDATDSPNKKAVLDRVRKILEISEGAPTLTIVEPKAKR